MPKRARLDAGRRPKALSTGPFACAAALVALFSIAPSQATPAAGGGLEIGLVAAALPTSDGSGELALPVVIELAPRDARTGATLSSGEIRLDLRFAADPAGAPQATIVEPFALGGGAEEAARGVRLYAEFRLAPGRYRLDASATDASGATGQAAAEVLLPESGINTWMASPALVVDRRSGWRAARARQSDARAVAYAFVDPGGTAFLPAATVEVPNDEPFAAQALVATPSRDFPFLVAEAIDLRDGSARPIPASIRGVSSDGAPGVLAAMLDLGPIGAAGDYRVRIGLAGINGALETPVGTSLLVRSRSAVAPGARASNRALSAEALARGADLADGYRRILAALPELGVEAAAAELVRFETAARAQSAEEDRREAAAELHEVQRRVAAKLDGESQGESARLAVAALHFAAAALYREQREVTIGADAAQLGSEILMDAERDFDDATRARAADLLSLARPTEALELDPNHTLALLRQSIHLERGRQFLEASQTLERLLRVQPNHAEGRLRAGVVFRRRDEPEKARVELSRVVAGPAPEWVTELAYSELGALEHDLGRHAEAERWLRQGIERVESQMLHLQLGFYLDRAHRSRESVAVVNHLPVARHDGRSSARHLYARESVEETAAARVRIATAVEAALPALRRALGATGERGVGR